MPATLATVPLRPSGTRPAPPTMQELTTRVNRDHPSLGQGGPRQAAHSPTLLNPPRSGHHCTFLTYFFTNDSVLQPTRRYLRLSLFLCNSLWSIWGLGQRRGQPQALASQKALQNERVAWMNKENSVPTPMRRYGLIYFYHKKARKES